MRRAGALVLLIGGLAASAAAAHPTATATVKVAKTRLGTILVDGRGRTLYLFTLDSKSFITCVTGYSNCPATWPPYLTTGRPTAGAGVNVGLLGTVHRTRPSGVQVTYNGHPLYVYAYDKKPGDLNGQGFINYWYVVSPAGVAIKKK
jgi:predicted lipoprotein with Yx(FWY)xxD motif